MSDLPRTVRLKEVGPREGFQFEKRPIPLVLGAARMSDILKGLSLLLGTDEVANGGT